MMGTSLLSIPWGIKQSGLIASVIIGLVMAFVAGYTAVLVIKIHAKYGKLSLCNIINTYEDIFSVLLDKLKFSNDCYQLLY